MHSFRYRRIRSWRLGHEKMSTAILPIPLIQEERCLFFILKWQLMTLNVILCYFIPEYSVLPN